MGLSWQHILLLMIVALLLLPETRGRSLASLEQSATG
jgi:Sec-independent protein translocase protein TatA